MNNLNYRRQGQNRLPPLYTHGIGSLPRPLVVRDLLDSRKDLPRDRFEQVMGSLVRFVIRLQEQAGLDVISDGEWRRTQYIQEFLSRAGGFERCRRYHHQGKIKFTEVVVRKMEVLQPVFLDDAKFLVANTNYPTKFALPSPFLIGIRYWHRDYSRDAYPTFQHFLEHLTQILSRETLALVDAGIQIIQLDDPALAYFCDERLLAGDSFHDERLRRNWDLKRQLPHAIRAINQISRRLGTEVHLHCCHSVHQRRSDVSGNYAPILPYFSNLEVDQINLEFAYPKTGELDDLKLVPKHLKVGMGIVDVRTEKLQSIEEMEFLALAGARIIGPERLALNPDCGFAPDSCEPPSLDEAYEKLCRLAETARRVRKKLL